MRKLLKTFNGFSLCFGASEKSVRARRSLGGLLLIITALLFLNPLEVFAQDRPEKLAEEIQKQLRSSVFSPYLYDSYSRHDYELLWVGKGQLSPAGQEIYALIRDAGEVGLVPKDYNYSEINRLWMDARYYHPDEFPAAQSAEMEILLTEGFIRYVSDLTMGLLNQTTYARAQLAPEITPKIPELLNAARNNESVEPILTRMQPDNPQYWKLLEFYSKAYNGDYQLDSDEKQELAANLEKMRWDSQRTLGQRYVYINLPSFTMQVYDAEEIVFSTKTIIGTENHPTPEMSKIITHMTLNPRWYMPRSIAIRQHLPKIQEDLEHLSRGNYRVYEQTEGGRFEEVDPEKIEWEEKNRENFDYYLWQDAGLYNALGRVVFRFPNYQAIFMHDTPDKHLFDQEKRAESSGCIRIENPMELAHYFLQDQPEWDRERIEEITSRENEIRVDLKEPVPIHIVYYTAAVNSSGELEFFEDLYYLMYPLKMALKRLENDN